MTTQTENLVNEFLRKHGEALREDLVQLVEQVEEESFTQGQENVFEAINDY